MDLANGTEQLNKNINQMKQLSVIFSIVVLTITMSCKESPKGEIKLVTPDEMQTLIESRDVQLVDVRSEDEYENGFIENAQNIDFNSPTFDEDISKLDKSKPVILYCKTGGRSAKCSKKLLEAGFIQIYELDGGITKWKFKGFELKTQP